MILNEVPVDISYGPDEMHDLEEELRGLTEVQRDIARMLFTQGDSIVAISRLAGGAIAAIGFGTAALARICVQYSPSAATALTAGAVAGAVIGGPIGVVSGAGVAVGAVLGGGLGAGAAAGVKKYIFS